MRYTFKPDDCMVINIPLGNLRNVRDGQLMPEKFTCIFKDAYKVFLKGRPKELGVHCNYLFIYIYIYFFQFSAETGFHTEKNYSLNMLHFFKVSGCNQCILATFK
uniref:Si:ch211-269k10.5 n=1 Tax=Sinocyclocheilus grahami TaxID=75366 RepID=A0A672MMK3_SINGR